MTLEEFDKYKENQTILTNETEYIFIWSSSNDLK
jgi:hypothetical protein